MINFLIKNQGILPVKLPVNNIHKNKQAQLMGFINQWFQFIWGSTAAARCKEIGDMVPA